MKKTITIWRLGDHKEGFLPSASVIDKLCKMVCETPDHIIWDSMLDVSQIEIEDYTGIKQVKEKLGINVNGINYKIKKIKLIKPIKVNKIKKV